MVGGGERPTTNSPHRWLQFIARIVAIADRHGRYREMPEIPPGDVLTHAGDRTAYRQLHDRAFERAPTEFRREIPDGILSLQNSGVTIGGVRFWCALLVRAVAAVRQLLGLQSRAEWCHLAAKWALIPEGVKVLWALDPPFGILDGAG